MTCPYDIILGRGWGVGVRGGAPFGGGPFWWGPLGMCPVCPALNPALPRLSLVKAKEDADEPVDNTIRRWQDV